MISATGDAGYKLSMSEAQWTPVSGIAVARCLITIAEDPSDGVNLQAPYLHPVAHEPLDRSLTSI